MILGDEMDFIGYNEFNRQFEQLGLLEFIHYRK